MLACHKQALVWQSDSGKTLFLTKGETAVIRLAENPTTGYGWIFTSEPENQKVFKVIHAKYIESANGLLGVGGIKEYKIKIKKRGKVIVNGYYVRSWENWPKETATQVHYTIEVK